MELETAVALGGSGSLPDAVVIELDGVAGSSAAEMHSAAELLAAHPGLTVGVASEPLTPQGRQVAHALVTTIARSDLGPVGVQVADAEVAAAGLVDAFARQPEA